MKATLTDRARIRIDGEGARAWLQNLVTADLDALAPDACVGAALLTPQGKILFDFLVATPSPDLLLIEVRDGLADALAQRLTFYRLRAKLAIGTPERVDVKLSHEAQGLRDVRFSSPVFRTHTPSGGAAETGDLDALRIAEGVAESGTDYVVGDAFPHDVNLDQTGGVGFRKGCYVGQEVVSRMQHRGTARKRLVIASTDGLLPPPFTPVFADGREIGQLGTVHGRMALSIIRLDKAADAKAAGFALTAGGAELALSLPMTARFPLVPESASNA